MHFRHYDTYYIRIYIHFKATFYIRMIYMNVSTCNRCNTGMSTLPDMYGQSQKVAGQRAGSIHIKQSTHACVATNT